MKLGFAIPRGWEVGKLEDVAEVRTGVAMGRNGLKNPVRVPYLRVANVQDGYLDLDEIKTIEVDEHEIPRYSLRSGDVLMNEGGDFDKLGRGQVWRGELPVCLHQNHVFAVRPDSTRLDSRFLNLFTGSFHGKRYFLACSKQSTNLASMNSTQLKAMPIPLPPLNEQKRIAEILGAWDVTIEKIGKLIEAKQRLKRGLMQRLLSSNASSSEAKLGDLFAERVERDRTDLKLLAVTGSGGVVDREDLVRRDTSAEDKSLYLRVCPGDIAYNTMRMWQGVCGLSALEGIVSPAYTVVTPNERISGRFASYLFKLPRMIRTFWRYSQGLVSDTLNLKFPNFAEIKVRIPQRQDQERIADLLGVIDSEIEHLTEIRGQVERQKRGLMQKLLTGQTRVKVKAAPPEVANA